MSTESVSAPVALVTGADRGIGLETARPGVWPFVGTPIYAASKAAINMMTVHFATLLPNIRINVADPGLTATDLSGGQGHSVHDGTDAIIAYALAARSGPSGTFADRDGTVPW